MNYEDEDHFLLLVNHLLLFYLKIHNCYFLHVNLDELNQDLFLFFVFLYFEILYNYNEILKYINDIINGCAIFSISLAQLLFFYCSNKIELENGEKKTKLNETIKNFVIINIFNQDDTD